jgi:hypothetical protein
MKQARKAGGGGNRQEGEKPWRRTETRCRESRGEWTPTAGCAEGARTPREVRAAERLFASPSGQTLKEAETSREDACVVRAAQGGAQRNTLGSRSAVPRKRGVVEGTTQGERVTQ